MHGGLGRVDGGIGIALDEPGILLEVQQSPEITVTGCDSAIQERLRGIASEVLLQIHAGSAVSITVRSHYPAHTGLGSGSQLALATARAICELYGKNVPVTELARLAGRGGTSGIGTQPLNTGVSSSMAGTASDPEGIKQISGLHQHHGGSARHRSSPATTSLQNGRSCWPHRICLPGQTDNGGRDLSAPLPCTAW